MTGFTLQALVLAFSAAIASACQEGYTTYFNGRCLSLKYDPSGKTASAWANNCAQDGAVLASQHSAEELAYMSNITSNYACIGLQCISGQLQWADGTPMDYHPLSTSCNTAYLYFMYNGGWTYSSDISRIFTYAFCEEPQQEGTCGSYTEASTGDCYKAFASQLNEVTAEKECEYDAAFLASIHSKDDNNFVRRTANGVGIAKSMFIGLKASGKGDYQWIDGTRFDYQNWAKGFPDASYGDCVYMVTGNSDGLWANTECDIVLPYICGRHYNTSLYASLDCPVGIFKQGDDVYSPGFPKAVINSGCTMLASVPNQKLVQLEVIYFNTNSCCDILTLFNEDGTVITTLKGYVPKGSKYNATKPGMVTLQWNPTSGANVQGFHFKVNSIS